jgi:hypothetical protein
LFWLISTQYYHSIHARGEKVEAVLKDAENEDQIDPTRPHADKADGLNPSGADSEEGPAHDRHIDERLAKEDRPGVSNHPQCDII